MGLLNDFLSLKNDVNVGSKLINQKTDRKFLWLPFGRSLTKIVGSGTVSQRYESVPKFHGSTTLNNEYRIQSENLGVFKVIAFSTEG